MRNPKRIKEMLVLIEKIWTKQPDLRLLQLLLNPLPNTSFYHVEDDLLYSSLKHTYAHLYEGHDGDSG